MAFDPTKMAAVRQTLTNIQRILDLQERLLKAKDRAELNALCIELDALEAELQERRPAMQPLG